MALMAADINMEEKTLPINKSLQRIDKKRHYNSSHLYPSKHGEVAEKLNTLESNQNQEK